VNLLFGRSAAITGKPCAGQNLEIMTVGVDVIILGQDCGIAPSASRIRA
jgi:hypothetical protein